MKLKSTKDKRSLLVGNGLRIVWSSLASHIDYTTRKSSEGKAFHRRTIQEYAELIKILSELY